MRFAESKYERAIDDSYKGGSLESREKWFNKKYLAENAIEHVQKFGWKEMYPEQYELLHDELNARMSKTKKEESRKKYDQLLTELFEYSI